MNREEWLQKHERQFEFACIGISERLSDYASSDEIAAVIAALKQLWSSHGKGVRAANKAGDFNTRNSLSKERSWIRRVIATLQANRIPSDNNSEDIDAILAPILARHRAAKQNAIERIKALAWEIESCRRDRWEQITDEELLALTFTERQSPSIAEIDPAVLRHLMKIRVVGWEDWVGNFLILIAATDDFDFAELWECAAPSAKRMYEKVCAS